MLCCRHDAELRVRQERQLPDGASAEALAHPRDPRKSPATLDLRCASGCCAHGCDGQGMLVRLQPRQ